ncbi:MAG: hypothetical protein ACTSVB_05595 [Candidatus Heimdallarchaeaceae archaeon]
MDTVAYTKLFGKDLNKIRRNKKAESKSFNKDLALINWYKRINILKFNKKYLRDPRLQKAAFLLTALILGSKYNIIVKSKEKISPKEGAKFFRDVFEKKNISRMLESLPNSLTSVSIIEKLKKLVKSEEEKLLLDEIASNVTNVYQIEEMINEFLKRVEITSVLFYGLKEAILLGDSFFEIVYDSTGILTIDKLDFTRVLPKYSKTGVILSWYYSSLVDEKAIVFYPYQILRFSFNVNGDIGEGLFFNTKDINRLAHKMERLMAISRETRSIQIRLHKPNYAELPENYRRLLTEEEVENYKVKFVNSLRKAMNVDIISNGLFTVDTVKSDGATFNEIKDVDFINQLFEIGLLIPTGIIDSGSKVDRATMDLQIKFLKGLVSLLECEAKRALEQLIKTELYLKNIDLDKYEIFISFDKSALLDQLDASKIVTRIKNKYNDFPEPILASIMGYSWDEFKDARIKESDFYSNFANRKKKEESIDDLLDDGLEKDDKE